MKNLININKNYFKITLGVTLFCFVIMTYGCYTTDIQDVQEEKIPTFKGTYLIQSIVTKSGEVIFFSEDNQPKFYLFYKDSSNVIVYSTSRIINAGEDKQKEIRTTQILPIKEISSIKVDRSKINATGSILAGVGILAGIVAIIAVIGIASMSPGFMNGNLSGVSFK